MAQPTPSAAATTTTLLFTDVEGSTRLQQELGETAYYAALETHRAILRTAAEGHDGREFGSEGDALFFAFGSPAGAVSAAVEMLRGLAAQPWPAGAEVRVRIGIHTGDVRRRPDGNFEGLALHRAARVGAAGHGGQALVSGTTAALVPTLPDGLALRPLGRFKLKDFDEPETLHQLTGPGLADRFPPPRTFEARPTNLPLQPTSFIGRETLVEGALATLAESRLMTLTGPGGTGKTRLSLRLAELALPDFADGAWFVPLAPIREPALVAPAIAAALRLPESSGRTLEERLTEHLGSRHLLLVLDNFEQLQAAAPFVGRLLGDAEGCKAVVTSRGPLRLAGEREFPVPPLEVPASEPGRPVRSDALARSEAVRLFVERARAVRPDFRLTEENAAAIAAICIRLDGLPLAIELAAARIRLLSPEAIRARLDQSLALLAGGARDLPERQQTLRGAITWSHDLLDDGGRDLFALLSIFNGGFTLEAAETICGGLGPTPRGIDLLGPLEALVDQGLLRAGEADGEPRFTMLETIREFAREQLVAAGRETAVRRSHAAYYTAVAEAAEPQLTGADRARWLDLLEREHDNLRAAIGWARESGDGATGRQLLSALWRFWQSRDHLVEGRDQATAILALPGEVPAALASRAHEAAGGLAWWSADFETVAAQYQRALQLARSTGDKRLIANALYNYSFTFSAPVSRPQLAAAAIEEALALYRELDDEAGRGRALWALGNAQFFGGDYRRAMVAFKEALDLARRAKDGFMTGWSLHMLGSSEILGGELAAAWGHLREAIQLMHAAGETTGIVLSLDDFAHLAAFAGDFPRSRRLNGAARALEDATGTRLAGVSAEIMARDNMPTGELSPDELERFAAEGRALNIDEAVALALALPRPSEPPAAAG